MSEEVLQLRADLERHKKNIALKDEMLEDLELELNQLKLSLRGNISAVEHETEIKKLKETINNLHSDCHTKDDQIARLSKDLTFAQGELQNVYDSAPKSITDRTLDDSNESNSDKLEIELKSVSEQLAKMHEDCESAKHEAVLFQNEVRHLREADEHNQHIVAELRSTLRKTQEEVTRLEGELFETRHNDSHKKQGNSIFSEAIEAERRLEDDLKRLFKENRALKQKIFQLKSDLEDAEIRALDAGNGNIYRKERSNEDWLEIEELRSKVQSLEREKMSYWIQFSALARKCDLKKMPGLVASQISTIDVKMKSLATSYDGTMEKYNQMAKMDRFMKINVQKLEKQLLSVESERKRLESHNALLQKRLLDERRKALQFLENGGEPAKAEKTREVVEYLDMKPKSEPEPQINKEEESRTMPHLAKPAIFMRGLQTPGNRLANTTLNNSSFLMSREKNDSVCESSEQKLCGAEKRRLQRQAESAKMKEARRCVYKVKDLRTSAAPSVSAEPPTTTVINAAGFRQNVALAAKVAALNVQSDTIAPTEIHATPVAPSKTLRRSLRTEGDVTSQEVASLPPYSMRDLTNEKENSTDF
ncbi:unnamed protein product [Caenorhabditis auriculariae]|uniref:Uncharacterized protein n=1 Tax=Caenorhabditis auriculariae TaxID=2777116 RepID=A0A8S1GXG6_9PELO|nr:unnamed protein product [Caenorhabditis auriculariae]